MTNERQSDLPPQEITLHTSFAEHAEQISAAHSQLNQLVLKEPTTVDTNAVIKEIYINHPRGGVAISVLVGLPGRTDADIDVALGPEIQMYDEASVWEIIAVATKDNEKISVTKKKLPTEQVIFSHDGSNRQAAG